MFKKRLKNQEGVALVVVLVGSFAALALAFAMVTYTTGTLNQAQNTENYGASISGSEAGVDDFLYRLNRDGNYWQYGLAGATAPPDGNQAFQNFSSVAGGTTNEKFKYKVIEQPTGANGGRITLQVTGQSRNSKRTLKVTLRRNGFLDYLYFTKYETRDPALYVKAPAGPDSYSPAEAQANCERYEWAAARPAECTVISFTQRDVINGPLHSNDTIRINTTTANFPKFNGETSSSKPTAPRYTLSGAGTPFFVNAGDPRYRATLDPPPSNSALKAEAKIGGVGTGCMYTGPTRIWLLATGKYRVKSPLTRSTNPGCGPVDASADVSLPTNGVIFVQNVPSLSTDPNANSYPPALSPSCSTVGWYPPINYPGGSPPSWTAPLTPITGDMTKYRCVDGDLFIQGTLKGQLTVGAENNVIVTNDLVYEGTVSPYNSVPAANSNILGIVANNFVEVYHPVKDNGSGASPQYTNLTTELNDVKIHAAILSVAHSFRVQQATLAASPGTLTVVGAIAQKFRGVVSTFSGSTISTGYAKDYNYDGRLKIISPPHFLDPVQSAWQVNALAEVKNP